MRFVVLTEAETGHKMRVNLDRVEAHVKQKTNDFTAVCTYGGGCYEVKETPEEIDECVRSVSEEERAWVRRSLRLQQR